MGRGDGAARKLRMASLLSEENKKKPLGGQGWTGTS